MYGPPGAKKMVEKARVAWRAGLVAPPGLDETGWGTVDTVGRLARLL